MSGKIIHMKNICPSQTAYIQNLLGQHPRKYSNDFVEQIIENKKQQKKGGKNVVQKNKV